MLLRKCDNCGITHDEGGVIRDEARWFTQRKYGPVREWVIHFVPRDVRDFMLCTKCWAEILEQGAAEYDKREVAEEEKRKKSNK